jgi:hypothetical protein
MAMRLSDCEEELAAVKARLKVLETQLMALGTERNELQNVAQGWEAIVAQKRKQAGDVQPDTPGPSVAQPPIDEDDPSKAMDSMTFSEEDEEEEGLNKTQFVRDEILKNAQRGTTAADLKHAAVIVKLKHPPSWPYGPLQRLKKGGEIVKRKGRFYPAPVGGLQPNVGVTQPNLELG